MYISLEEAIFKCENCWYPFDNFKFKNFTIRKVYTYRKVDKNEEPSQELITFKEYFPMNDETKLVEEDNCQETEFYKEEAEEIEDLLNETHLNESFDMSLLDTEIYETSKEDSIKEDQLIEPAENYEEVPPFQESNSKEMINIFELSSFDPDFLENSNLDLTISIGLNMSQADIPSNNQNMPDLFTNDSNEEICLEIGKLAPPNNDDPFLDFDSVLNENNEKDIYDIIDDICDTSTPTKTYFKPPLHMLQAVSSNFEILKSPKQELSTQRIKDESTDSKPKLKLQKTIKQMEEKLMKPTKPLLYENGVFDVTKYCNRSFKKSPVSKIKKESSTKKETKKEEPLDDETSKQLNKKQKLRPTAFLKALSNAKLNQISSFEKLELTKHWQ